MKYIYLFALILISFQGQSQKLIAQSGYNHDSTGYYASDSAAIYYIPGNTTTATQDLNVPAVGYYFDSMYHYYGANLDLGAIAKNTYDAGYTHLLAYNGDSYSNGVHTYHYLINYFYTGMQADSTYYYQTDIVNNVTHISEKYYYHSNAQNQVDTTWYIYLNNIGAYSSSYKYVNLYTGNNITEVLSYQSSDSVNYTVTGKTAYYFNANNSYDSIVSYSWLGGNWMKQAKISYTYNANQYVTLKEWFGYDNVNNVYVNTSREHILRNNNVTIDTLYSQLWNQGLQKFDTTIKKAYVYQSGLLTRSYGYNINYNNMQWQPDPYGAINNYYYDMIPSTVSSCETSYELILYPNPAESALQMKNDMTGRKYSIVSSDGRFMQSGLVNSYNQVFIQNLSPGIYSLLIENEGGYGKAMFIKQ